MANALAGSAAASGYRVTGSAPSDPTNNWGNDQTGANNYNPVGVGHGLGTNEASGGILYQDNTYRATNPYVDPNAYNFGGTQNGAQDWINANQAASQAAQARTGPDMGANQYGQQYQQDRGALTQAAMNQQGALNNYQGVISGGVPSVAQNQLAQGQQANQAAMASQAASARGGGANMAAAQRLAMENGSQSGANLNQQSSLLRANEISQAMGGYANQANAMRSGAQAQAGLSGQMAQNQGQFQQAATGQNDAMAQFYGQQNYNVANQQLQAQQQRYAQQSQNQNEVQKMNMQANEGNAERGSAASKGVLGGAMSALGGMAMVSDMRMKENIKPAGGGPTGAPKVGDTLAAMQPYSYQYKDPAMGQGQRAGIMAQDLERTPLGRAAVIQDQGGTKAIDMKAAMGLAMAGASDHEKRLRALEDEAKMLSQSEDRVQQAREMLEAQKKIGALHGGDPVGAYQDYYRQLNIRQAIEVEMQKNRAYLESEEADYPARKK